MMTIGDNPKIGLAHNFRASFFVLRCFPENSVTGIEVGTPFYVCLLSLRIFFVAGGESGPGARPMEQSWVAKIREQCLEAGVPFFFKQWGGVYKKKTGRLLDGRTWEGLPAGVTASRPAATFALQPTLRKCAASNHMRIDLERLGGMLCLGLTRGVGVMKPHSYPPRLHRPKRTLQKIIPVMFESPDAHESLPPNGDVDEPDNSGMFAGLRRRLVGRRHPKSSVLGTRRLGMSRMIAPMWSCDPAGVAQLL